MSEEAKLRITRRKMLMIIAGVAVAAAAVGTGLYLTMPRKRYVSIFGRPAKPEEVKPIFIYVGPVGDVGWTYNHHYHGLKYIEEKFGIKSFYAESVAAPDAPRIVEEFINTHGVNTVVFTDAIEVYNPDLSLPKKYKDIYFIHCAGYEHSLPNLCAFYGRMYEARYVTGVIAGRMTKSNKIGYVAAHPIPEVITGLNAFTLGVRRVNPDAEVHVAFTHSWYDPGTERTVADSLIGIGCDILTQHCDSPATQIAAEEAGIMSLVYQSVEMMKFAPHAALTGACWNWRPIYDDIFRRILEGRFENKWYYPGMKEGVCILAPYNRKLLPKEVIDEAEKIKKDIISGRLKIWKGPIYDRDGVLRIPEGYVPTEEEVWKGMTWVVPGVVGEIPKPKI